MDHLNLVACLYRPLENDIFCIHSSHSVPSEVLRNFCDDVGCWFWIGVGFDSMARGLVIHRVFSPHQDQCLKMERFRCLAS